MWLVLALSSSVAASGCAAFARGSNTTEASDQPTRKPVVVEMPWETTKVRDDRQAPVLRVETLDDGVDGVPVPYLYGYPIWGSGEALQGIVKLRSDNATGSRMDEWVDEHGVKYRAEELPEIACAIEGFRETEVDFVPILLRCQLPPPKSYGGKRRPVVGKLRTGARAKDVLAEPSLKKAFLGDWHLVEGDPTRGDGKGFFNTEYGQLAFEFTKGRLKAVSYYFDPERRQWRQPMLWMAQ